MRAFTQKPVTPHQDLPAKSSLGGRSSAAGLALDDSWFEKSTTEGAMHHFGQDYSLDQGGADCIQSSLSSRLRNFRSLSGCMKGAL